MGTAEAHICVIIYYSCGNVRLGSLWCDISFILRYGEEPLLLLIGKLLGRHAELLLEEFDEVGR